jgi:hypothetical protein
MLHPLCPSNPPQVAYHVAVWIEQAERGHLRLRKAALPSGFPQQVGGLEYRRGAGILEG